MVSARRAELVGVAGEELIPQQVEAVDGVADVCLGEVGKVPPGGSPGRDDDLGRASIR